jgi:hypothetical protein
MPKLLASSDTVESGGGRGKKYLKESAKILLEPKIF